MKNVFIDNLVREWSWRVNDGMPDPKNRSHIVVLEAVLRQYKYSDSFIKAYISQLTEETKFQARSKESGKIVDFKSKESMEKAVKDGSHDTIKKKKGKKADDDEDKKHQDLFGTGDTNTSPTVKPGTLSDADDPETDSKIKQASLDYGHKKKVDKDGNVIFKPAPGNASSMYNEIMSGECAVHLDKNPNLTPEELAEIIYEQTVNTTLGKQIGKSGLLKKKQDGTYSDKSKALITAKAGIKKWKNTKAAIKNLGDKIDAESVKSRNYYGHQESKDAQIALVEKSSGPFYTSTGKEIKPPFASKKKTAKEEIIRLIQEGGGEEVPTDTATLSVDKNGVMLVEFHSDKQETNDIQGSSTPTKETRKAIKVIDKSNLSEDEKIKAKEIISNSGKKLKEIEDKIAATVAKPALELGKIPISKIIKVVNDNDGTNLDAKGKKEPNIKGKMDSLISRKKPHPFIEKYLPKDSKPPYTDEQLLTAFFKATADGDNNPNADKGTADQQKLMLRISKKFDLDPTTDLAKLKEDSVNEIQRGYVELNEKQITLTDGTKIGLGDYVESQNIKRTLHIGGPAAEVEGLFNVNMGGIVVNQAVINDCLDIDTDDEFDFERDFEVGIVKEDESDDNKYSRNANNEITGRNIMVYYMKRDKEGNVIDRVPFAKKTQRAGDGPASKLRSTYSWSKETQECFENHPSNTEENQ
jgi:hypothetical protein